MMYSKWLLLFVLAAMSWGVLVILYRVGMTIFNHLNS